MNIVLKSLSLLTARERKSGLMLLGLTVLKGFADMLGVAAVLPFLAVLASPSVVQTNPYLSKAYDFFGFTSVDGFLFAIGASVILVMVVAAFFRALTVYYINRWTEMREYYLSRRLLETYLRQPYEFYISNNTSEMSSSILALARNAVIGSYRPIADITSGAITIAFIAGFLFWNDPVVTSLAIVGIGLAYGLLYLSLRGVNLRLGQVMVQTNNERFRTVHETLSSVKHVKLSGRGRFFLEKYSVPSLLQARARALAGVIRQIPRYGLEVVAFGGIISLTLLLLQRSSEMGSERLAATLPLLGVYALASYRLMPIAQVVYGAFTTLRSAGPVVEAVHREMQALKTLDALPPLEESTTPKSGKISFENVSYAYPNTSGSSLQHVSFDIEPGMCIGVVGPTGAGKTTLIDLILGLLAPSQGRILIDDAELTQSSTSLREWQASIGYVPQEIFINDASVAENIAMGLAPEEISTEQLERAARLAKIHDFIVSELEEGYDTPLGERGIRLSGGQRQRFGIARALYHDPKVIVFDEATSALDGATEQDVMSAINGLYGTKTILMIAHRMSTIQNCDKIMVLEKGRITGMDSFEVLSRDHETFKALQNPAGVT